MTHTLFRNILVILLTVVCGALPAQQATTATDAIHPDWQKIEGLETQKALEEIEKIYWATLNEKQYIQTLNAIAYRMKRQREIQKDATGLLIDSLKLDAERLPQPAKSIIYSLIADEYRAYFRDRWYYLENRPRASAVNDDYTTWDISRLTEEALKYFKLSIQDAEILQQTPIDAYKELLLIVPKITNKKPTLPTLYDLLVFQALQTFSYELSNWLPQLPFAFNQAAYFADAHTFANCQIPAIDTLSAKYLVLSLFQQALRFRLQQPDDDLNRYALVSMDIERLQYVHDKGQFGNSDMLFEKALKDLIDKYQAYPEKYYPMYALANLYKDQAEKWRKALRNKYIEAYDLCEQIAASGDSVLSLVARRLQDEIKIPSVELALNYLQYPETPL